MWTYDKKLEYPVNIKNPNAAMAKVIITQFGGPDCQKGCTAASLYGRTGLETHARRERVFRRKPAPSLKRFTMERIKPRATARSHRKFPVRTWPRISNC